MVPLSSRESKLSFQFCSKVLLPSTACSVVVTRSIRISPVFTAFRTELLDSGDIDCVLATFTITDERKKSWDFTTPYYTDYVTVLVEDASGIKTLADLKDKKVGVSSGSTSGKALVKAMIEAGVLGCVPDTDGGDDGGRAGARTPRPHADA